MRKVRAVIRREYLERVRTKAFVFTTFGAPLLMLALILVPVYLASRGEDGERRLAVVDRTGVLYERVARELEGAGYAVERARGGGGDAGRRELGRVLSGETGGYLVLDSATLGRGRAVYRGRDRPGGVRSLALRHAVVQAALEARLARDSLGSDLLAGGELVVDVVAGSGTVSGDEPRFWIGYAGAFALYVLILMHAVAVMRSVLEEKTSRIVEVVISSLRPWELMLGKVVGVGAVGLTQFFVWVLFGAVIALWGLPALAAAGPEALAGVDVSAFIPGPGFLLVFGLLFLLGFFLYAALYAAVGAMCSREEEAQQAQFPVLLLLLVPLMALVPVLETPGSALSVALSLVPFFAPVLLVARMGAGAVAPWEVAVAVTLLVAAILAVAWLAGRIYRVGILMQGKRPTLPELWRWIREA